MLSPDRFTRYASAASDESRADLIVALQRTCGNPLVTRMLLRATAPASPIPKFSPSQCSR